MFRPPQHTQSGINCLLFGSQAAVKQQYSSSKAVVQQQIVCLGGRACKWAVLGRERKKEKEKAIECLCVRGRGAELILSSHACFEQVGRHRARLVEEQV